MKKWWWRIALAVLGLALICCSCCLVTYTRLSLRRDLEREVVPLEVPPVEPTPSSLWLSIGRA